MGSTVARKGARGGRVAIAWRQGMGRGRTVARLGHGATRTSARLGHGWISSGSIKRARRRTTAPASCRGAVATAAPPGRATALGGRRQTKLRRKQTKQVQHTACEPRGPAALRARAGRPQQRPRPPRIATVGPSQPRVLKTGIYEASMSTVSLATNGRSAAPVSRPAGPASGPSPGRAGRPRHSKRRAAAACAARTGGPNACLGEGRALRPAIRARDMHMWLRPTRRPPHARRTCRRKVSARAAATAGVAPTWWR